MAEVFSAKWTSVWQMPQYFTYITASHSMIETSNDLKIDFCGYYRCNWKYHFNDSNCILSHLKLNIVISRNISLDLELWEAGLLGKFAPRLCAVHPDPCPTLAPPQWPPLSVPRWECQNTMGYVMFSVPQYPNPGQQVLKGQCIQRWWRKVHREACLIWSIWPHSKGVHCFSNQKNIGMYYLICINIGVIL